MNLLQVSGFLVATPRLRSLQLMAQRVSVPGLSIGYIEQPTPFGLKPPLLGDRVDFEDLMISFKVDEEMKTYVEMTRWLRESVGERSYKQRADVVADKSRGVMSDITVTTLDSRGNPGVSFKFIDCFPVSVSSVTLDVTMSDVGFATVDVSFKHAGYEVG